MSHEKPSDDTRHEALADVIEAAFRDRAAVSSATSGEVRDAVDEALGLLDSGTLRVAERGAGEGAGAWHVNQWLKKAVLLSFRLNDMTAIPGGPGGSSWWDKVPSKFDGWGPAEHAAAGFRSGAELRGAPLRLYRLQASC